MVKFIDDGKLKCKGCGSSDTVSLMADTAHREEYTCRKCLLLMLKEGAFYESGKKYRKEKPKTTDVPTGYTGGQLADRPG